MKGNYSTFVLRCGTIVGSLANRNFFVSTDETNGTHMSYQSHLPHRRYPKSVGLAQMVDDPVDNFT